MRTHSLERFFPPPTYLYLPAVGLDVSDQSIKYVELARSPHGLRLGKYGSIPVPLGIIASGKILDHGKLASILQILKKEKKFSSLSVSLPEEQVYSYRLNLPLIEYKEIRNTIELSLEEHIPISALDATFDFSILKEKEDGFDVQVSAVQTELMESYLAVFNEAGLSPISFTLEGTAIARALIRHEDKGTYMIVDFGETRTGISIVSHGATLFSSTVDIGGYSLTKMIEKNFSIPFAEAEKMKKSFVLEKTNATQELFNVLISGIAVLRDEINRHFIYWQSHKDEVGGDNSKIEKILLCGGNSNMDGLSDYLSQSLRVKVELGNPWVNVDGYANDIPEMNLKESLGYATAIGLALGHFEHD